MSETKTFDLESALKLYDPGVDQEIRMVPLLGRRIYKQMRQCRYLQRTKYPGRFLKIRCDADLHDAVNDYRGWVKEMREVLSLPAPIVLDCSKHDDRDEAITSALEHFSKADFSLAIQELCRALATGVAVEETEELMHRFASDKIIYEEALAKLQQLKESGAYAHETAEGYLRDAAAVCPESSEVGSEVVLCARTEYVLSEAKELCRKGCYKAAVEILNQFKQSHPPFRFDGWNRSFQEHREKYVGLMAVVLVDHFDD